MKKLKISFEEKPKTEKRKYKRYPRIDPNTCAFGDEEDIETANVDYIRKIKAKVLRRYLLPTIIVSILIVVAISYLLINTYSKELHESEAVIASQKEQIEELETFKRNHVAELVENYKNYLKEQGYYNNAESSYSNGRELGRAILQERGYYHNTENTSANDNSPRLCAVPNCNRAAETGSEYCYSHECAEFSCHEKIANDRCRYCEYHKCTVPDCNNERQDGSYYCFSHECIYPGCHKKKVGISYCAEHQK